MKRKKIRRLAIVVIVSIGITILVISMAVLYTWALDFPVGGFQTPTVTVHTTHLEDIANLDPDHEHTDITFYDNDHDEHLSRGDMFWIKHLEHGGQAQEGYRLWANFELSGDKMNGGEHNLDEATRKKYFYITRQGRWYTELNPLFLLPVWIIIIVLVISAYEKPRSDPPFVIGAMPGRDGDNYTVTVEKADPTPTSLMNVYCSLVDANNSHITGTDSNLVEILNLDPNHASTNISFYDNDHDEQLSRGDLFWIKHLDHGGRAEEGYKLLVKFEPTGDKMNGGGTLLG